MNYFATYSEFNITFSKFSVEGFGVKGSMDASTGSGLTSSEPQEILSNSKTKNLIKNRIL